MMKYDWHLLAVKIGDVPLGLVLFVLIGMIAGALIGGALVIKKKVQADENLPAYEITGRVIEKMTEQDGIAGILTFTVEWVIVEDEKGNREKYRNTRTKEIFISPGDYCKMTLRGYTIYEYARVKERQKREVIV